MRERKGGIKKARIKMVLKAFLQCTYIRARIHVIGEGGTKYTGTCI